MNFEVQIERETNMDTVQPSSDQHICYVRCNFCNTLLAIGIPCKRQLDTVTVKCGHCSNLSFLTIRLPPPPPQGHCFEHPLQPPSLSPAFQQAALCSDFKNKGQSSSSSSSTPNEPTSPKARFVIKPPERKHRLPSAYNQYMREEIQRIKASNPRITHREAFSKAAKSWATYNIIDKPKGSISASTSNVPKTPNEFMSESTSSNALDFAWLK